VHPAGGLSRRRGAVTLGRDVHTYETLRTMIPPLPQNQPATFRTTVHGTVFGDRSTHLAEVDQGDPLVLIPDPPMEEEPAVWVHCTSGDPLGHLPPEINRWLAPWLLRGGAATATAVRVRGSDVPSWKRLLIEVHCADAAIG
jgi:hypothetical protein